MPWGFAAASVAGAVANHALNSGSSSRSSADQMPAMTPEQQAALQQLLAQLSGGRRTATPFNGSLSPNMGGVNRSLAALEQQSMDSIARNDETRGRLEGIADDSGTDIEAMFRDSVQNPLMKQFKEEIIPETTRRFGGMKAYGSDRQAMEGRDVNNLAGQLASSKSKLLFDATEARKNRALQATGMMPGLDMNNMSFIRDLLSGHMAGAGLEQGGIDRRYADLVRGDDAENTRIQQLLAALGMSTSNTVVRPGTPSFLNSAAPGAGNALTQWLLRNYGTTGSGGGGSGGGGYEGINWNAESGLG